MRFSPRVLLLIILIASFLIRIQRLDYPLSHTFKWGDGTRDFLVANHILKYQEFPLVGPFNLLYESSIRSSPLYFYLLALFLIPFNHILTFSFINICLQILVIVLVYLIAKQIFSQTTALVAVTLFSFNPEVLHYSDFIWQPHLMLPFGLLALYFLIQRQMLFSFSFLAVSFALHNSFFPWLPVFFIQALKMRYFLPFIPFALLLMLFYLAVFNNWTSGFVDNPIIVHSIYDYGVNLASNIQIFLASFNLPFPSLQLSLLIALSIFSLTRSHLANWILMMIALVLLPIIFASFFNKIRLHYLILSMPIFCIICAKIISSIPNKVFVVLLFLIFLKFFSQDLAILQEDIKPFQNQKLIDEITLQIKDDLEPIKNDFQVRAYAQSKAAFYYPILDTVLLVPLERQLNQKLAKVADNSPFNHLQIGGSKYLVVSCHHIINKDLSECLNTFSKDHPQYAILKILYEEIRISIFLATLTNNY